MEILISIVVLVFLFDLLDSSVGMGLGTLSVPALLMMGYEPLQVILVLVLDAAISGWISGWFHHEFENVRFSLRRPLSEETKTLLLIAGVGCVSIFSAVIITHHIVKPPDIVLKLYVGLLVIFMGFVGLLYVKSGREHNYKPKFLALFATLAGLNNGVGGGGYGPVVVMGGSFPEFMRKHPPQSHRLQRG